MPQIIFLVDRMNEKLFLVFSVIAVALVSGCAGDESKEAMIFVNVSGVSCDKEVYHSSEIVNFIVNAITIWTNGVSI